LDVVGNVKTDDEPILKIGWSVRVVWLQRSMVFGVWTGPSYTKHNGKNGPISWLKNFRPQRFPEEKRQLKHGDTRSHLLRDTLEILA
jgi:hypothetical protein